jgi:predicted nucleic acid-binding protein
MGTLDRIAAGSLYLDTNVFVYWLEGYAAFSQVLGDLFTRLTRGQFRGVTSEFTLAKCLVKPMIDQNQTRQSAFQAALVSSNGLLVQPVSREILIEAARMRATLRLTLPDAVHVATAHLTGYETFLTNDHRLRTPVGITVATMMELSQQ